MVGKTLATKPCEISKMAKGLHSVDLGWCRAVDDFVIRDILDGCKGNLREVKVWGCNRVEGNWTRDGKKRACAIFGIESDRHAINFL